MAEERPVITKPHPDDIAVDEFATKMKAKLAQKRAHGRGGWERQDVCSQADLSRMLREHVEKGDPVDVANLSMMLSARGERILPAVPPEPPADLVKRAQAALNAWQINDEDDRRPDELIAAFAAEYAAEVTSDMASRFADDIAFWKHRAEVRSVYIDHLKARAEAAEKDRDALLSALGLKCGPISGDRQVILDDVSGLRPEMAKARRQAADEREACAKVADDEAAALGGNDSAQAWLAAQRIAATIRARKGGGDDSGA